MLPSKSVQKLTKASLTTRGLISDSVMMSPCLAARERLPGNTKLYLKAENFQHTGSFKIRGALSKLKRLPKDLELITASSGNHGIACSHAAQTTEHN